MVPQFIDVEDKILGPITSRQFVLMLVAALFEFIFYTILQFWLFLIIGIIVFIMFGILAFIKVNGMPFHFFILNIFQTFRRPSVRIWNKELKKGDLKELAKIDKKEEVAKEISEKRISENRLSKLSLVVNTGGVYRGEDELNNNHIKQPDTPEVKQRMPERRGFGL